MGGMDFTAGDNTPPKPAALRLSHSEDGSGAEFRHAILGRPKTVHLDRDSMRRSCEMEETYRVFIETVSVA